MDSIPVSACSLGGFSKELSRKEKFFLYPSCKETYICFLNMSGCHVFFHMQRGKDSFLKAIFINTK